METINNAASAASKAIWGDPTTKTSEPTESEREPVSGETGNTSNGEPYDAGNKDSTNTDSTRTTPGIPSSSTDSSIPGATDSTEPICPELDSDKSGVTSTHQPASGFSSDKPTSSNDTAGPGETPSRGVQGTTKQQGADLPADEPEHGSDEHEAIKEAKKEAEDAQNVDTSGPGPKPLAETGGPSGPTGADEEDGPQKESHGEGTGEKWVKSSGTKADGGNFDASAPGAGKEADRLLDDKGVHRTADAPKGEDEKKADPLEGKVNKPSLGDKIKAKLHLDHKDKSDQHSSS